jgi:uncharacterized membrane protein
MMKLPGQRREPRIPEDHQAAPEGIGRILALSDGVFAIAITLLVIQIALPATAGTDLPSALLRLWPRYLAYVLSFLVIARFWFSHHLAFRLITRYDGMLVWLNLVLLMFVAFLPFPTAVLGEHLAAPAAAVLYAMAAGLTSAASAGYWWYASGRGRLLKPGLDRLQVTVLRARSLSGPVFFALTLPVAAYAPYAAEAMWILGFPLARISVVWFITAKSQQPRRSKEHRRRPCDDGCANDGLRPCPPAAPLPHLAGQPHRQRPRPAAGGNGRSLAGVLPGVPAGFARTLVLRDPQHPAGPVCGQARPLNPEGQPQWLPRIAFSKARSRRLPRRSPRSTCR